jgi:hypothetical protein
MGEARNRKLIEERRSAMNGTCQTCAHFSAIQNECRAHAPRVFLVPGPKGEARTVAAFPPVKSDFWCGEHSTDLGISADGADRAARQSM